MFSVYYESSKFLPFTVPVRPTFSLPSKHSGKPHLAPRLYHHARLTCSQSRGTINVEPGMRSVHTTFGLFAGQLVFSLLTFSSCLLQLFKLLEGRVIILFEHNQRLPRAFGSIKYSRIDVLSR